MSEHLEDKAEVSEAKPIAEHSGSDEVSEAELDKVAGGVAINPQPLPPQRLMM